MGHESPTSNAAPLTGQETHPFIEELRWRGLLAQVTHEAELARHLHTGTRSAYVGYDPTADSLTIGNLVTIMLLIHFQRHGHEPVVVMGGGTGLIGDPSGKSAERQLMTEEIVRANVEKQRPIFERLFANAAKLEGKAGRPPAIVNNIDWLGKLGFLEALRDVGKYFSVNTMIQKDSVRERLNRLEQGISYTEFSYMILQSYDYLVLFRDFAAYELPRPVTLQMGGSDQWGNIVSGTYLIARWFSDLEWVFHKNSTEYMVRLRDCGVQEIEQRWLTLAEVMVKMGGQESGLQVSDLLRIVLDEELSCAVDSKGPLDLRSRLQDIRAKAAIVSNKPNPQCLTAPLITKADGGKFGKTETGAIWLTPERTSPYAYYQFWLNSSDADMGKFLRIFTLMPRDRIEAIEAEHAKDPGQRLAQRELARAATALLHGQEAVEQAEAAAKALFSGEIAHLPAATLAEVFASVPSSSFPKSNLAGPGVACLDLLVDTKLASSKREAREFLSAGSVTVNGRKVGLEDFVTEADLLHGTTMAVRRGKKSWHVAKWE